MSLASDYAASQATAAADQVTANASVPAPFVGPNGRAEVTASGGMRLVPTGTSPFEIPAAGAVAFATWITDTFT